MLRYSIIAILLMASDVMSQDADIDDQTLAWLQQNFPGNDQNNNNQDNMQPSQQKKDTEAEDDILNWITDLVQTDSNNKTNTELNLDPSNVIIQNSSLSKPTEPTNKFDKKTTSTPYAVSVDCFAERQKQGKCVKRSMCEKEADKVDPTELFTYKDPTKNEPPNGCGFLNICCPVDKVRTEPVKPASAPAPGCGRSNPAVSVFRAGAPDAGYADFAEFPWMVALLTNHAGYWTSDDYIGGGTLIHRSVVLTTAHKVDSVQPSDLKVRAGEWNTESESEIYDHQDRAVNNIILHEQFNRRHAQYDVALLFTVNPFEIQPHINVACLSPSLPVPGTVCYGMGWGEDFTRGKYYANVLKKITLPLMHPQECERRFKNSKLGSTYTLHRSLICAGGQPNVDTCLGDGGSPLVCPIGVSKHTERAGFKEAAEHRYAVVGMVAYGLGCGSASTPGTYASVPEVYYWVGRQLSMRGFGGRHYVY